MKKIVILGLLIMLLAPIVQAEEGELIKEGNNWINADSSFHFLDRASEKIELFFASEEKKPRIKLEHGYERLTEAKDMIKNEDYGRAKELIKEAISNFADASKMAADGLINEEEWEKLKSAFQQKLAELQGELTTNEFGERVKDFFNPED
jgi:enoyl-CoA hydratase/carnithine racemase